LTWGQDGAGADIIQPPDVFVHVDIVRAELERLRYEMGKPINHQAEIGVRNAAPREVFFQALTLFRKADRLCFEQTRERAELPKPPIGEVRPEHVYHVVDEALGRIRVVKGGLEISSTPQTIPRDPAKTPTDVFRSTVQANRQLNLLLDQRFSPSDVFQQVTVAIGFTSSLLARFPGEIRIPEEPSFEAGKLPADVYRRLVGCFERVRMIAHTSGLDMLELETSETRIQQATPSDVFDIASLLVSELAYLHGKLRDSEPPRRAYFPGRKFPSHVFQRAGILEQQLISLDERIQQQPNWLEF
jgi:hypothetical protein